VVAHLMKFASRSVDCEPCETHIQCGIEATRSDGLTEFAR